jgi:hypothetical protein
MWWLIIGLVLGLAGWWLATLARAKKISIKWYTWVLVVLAVLMAALTAMDYNTLTLEMEPAAAGAILWLFGTPALVFALIAVGLIWWQNRQVISLPKKS